MKCFLRSAAVVILGAMLAMAGLPCDVRGSDAALAEKVKAVGGSLGSFKGGGTAIYFRSAPSLTEDFWKLLESIDDLKSVYYNDATNFGDAELQRLCRIKSLERIFVNGAAITDAGFSALANLPTLRYFGAHHSFKFSGKGLAPLKNCSNLVSLEFGGSAFDDEGLRVICEFTQLEELVVGGTRATSAAFPNLAKLVNLQKLHLSTGYFPHFTAADFGHLAPLKKLQELTIGRMVLPYGNGLSHLKQLKGLKKLQMTTCGVTAADLDRLKADLPNVTIEWTPAPEENIQSWNREMELRKSRKMIQVDLPSK